MKKGYDFNEWGYGAQFPNPPGPDMVALAVAIIVTVGIALSVALR